MGDFLRARRDRITPAEAGIEPFPGPRRVPGLRREELATLAGLSPDYLRRLEQGRQANVSDHVLDALARALRLDETQRQHLHDLASPSVGQHPATYDVPQRPNPGLMRVLRTLGDAPVLLLGRRGEVLARTPMLASVLGSTLEPGTSFTRFLFQDPLARQRIVNWPDFAAASVAALRREAGLHPHDSRLSTLIEELRGADADVARWWDDHRVVDYASVVKHIEHPVAGRLVFDIEIVAAPRDSDQRLVVYTAEPDTPTARMLPLLASWDLTAPR